MTAQAGTAGSDRRIRVLLVDDQAIVRKGIRALLAEIPGIEVVGKPPTASKRWPRPPPWTRM